MDAYEKRDAGKGLYYLFLGQILSLAALIPLLGGVILIVAGLISLWAFYSLSKLNSGYKNAFLMTIANIVVEAISIFFAPENGFLSVACSFITMFLNAMVIYYVCNTTSDLLRSVDVTVAELGQKVWKGVILFTAIDMICIVLSVVPLIGILALIVSIVVWVAQVVISILYLVFLWRSQKVLRV